MSLATRSFKDIKVGLDCANGSATAVAKGVFDALGARTYVISNEPDGTNINLDCGSTHIEKLQAYVKEKGLDVGFAYDGDADRCLAVDDKGKIIDGDLILYICGRYMKEKGELSNDTVVTTIMSNFGLYKAFDRCGISYEKTAVGDKYVYENMMNNGHRLGGEQSGHIIFSKYAATGDGVLTSLMLMEVMLEKKMKLSDLTKEIEIYPQLLVNVRVASKPLARQDEEVVEIVAKAEAELGSEGRILLRESGTEPVLRVMVEAKSDEICKKYVESVVEVLNRRGHVVAD
jgi:phosphoglucosamine mutase